MRSGREISGVGAAMNDVDLVAQLFATFPGHQLAVVFGNGDGEFGSGEFLPQHATVNMNVVSVGGEAEWNSRQAMDDQSAERGVGGEVRVYMGDTAALHVVRKRYRFGQEGEGAQKKVR